MGQGILISSFIVDSAPCLVEMEKENAWWNVVEEKTNVTLTLNHKPLQAVILVPVLCGKLVTGVR